VIALDATAGLWPNTALPELIDELFARLVSDDPSGALVETG
jgi:hypothetical protein